MTPALIAQLIIALGPAAFNVIKKLVELWKKPELTPEEVNAICDSYLAKSYEDYINDAGGRPVPK